MKRIFALLLVVVLCASALTSCQILDMFTGGGGKSDGFNEVAVMYADSQPTKITAKTTHKLDEAVVLNGTYELKVGEVDGKPAATYVGEYDELRTVDEGSGQEIKEHVVTKSFSTDYIEGKGVRYNGGEWDATGTTIIPAKGGIALNIDASLATSSSYKDNKLTFVVAANNTEKLLGEGKGVNAPVQVEIVTDGSLVVGVTLSYTLPADTATNAGEIQVKIEVLYFYDLELLTIV